MRGHKHCGLCIQLYLSTTGKPGSKHYHCGQLSVHLFRYIGKLYFQWWQHLYRLPGGGTGNTASYSPTTSTTYTIISSNGTCTSSITQSVQVVPLPNISAVASTYGHLSGQLIQSYGQWRHQLHLDARQPERFKRVGFSYHHHHLYAHSVRLVSNTVLLLWLRLTPLHLISVWHKALRLYVPGGNSTLTPSGVHTHGRNLDY